MKVGLIRCLQTEDMCPATTCFKVMALKKRLVDASGRDALVQAETPASAG